MNAYNNKSEVPIPPASNVWDQLFEQESRTIKYMQENNYLPGQKVVSRNLKFSTMSRVVNFSIVSTNV